MASLVADYGSSSENDDGETDDGPWKISNISEERVEESKSTHFIDDDADDDDVDAENIEKRSPVLENPFRTVSNESNNGVRKNCVQSHAVPLSATVSVFSNPYKEVEDAQQSLLEKHVKMTPNRSQNCSDGRQVCWNYRKGRCRFGHNCKFAHDSDLPAAAANHPAAPSKYGEADSSTSKDPDATSSSAVPKDETKKNERKKKKRPGLSQTLIPSKKVMKNFYSQVQQEKPWLVTK